MGGLSPAVTKRELSI